MWGHLQYATKHRTVGNGIAATRIVAFFRKHYHHP